MRKQMIAIEGIQMPDNCHQCDTIGISDLVGIKCPCAKNEESYDFENRPNGCPLKMVREIKHKGGNMESPFLNDMYAMVYQAFKKLYPDKECQCQWQPEKMTAEDGKEVLGLTTWDDDGFAYVDISVELRVADAVEILAHELAHVAVGSDEEHGKAWEEAFDAIHNEFDRIGNEMFGTDDAVAVDVVSGKAYTRENTET